MFEVKGNLWELPADALCITTNGFVKSDGKAVMGRGCAKEATERMPSIDERLGRAIKENGNIVQQIGFRIYSFPVKHHWKEKADLDLIEKSCIQLVEIVDYVNKVEFEAVIKWVAIPRPGCGNGGRDWLTEVKPICEKYFDNRFGVVTYA